MRVYWWVLRLVGVVCVAGGVLAWFVAGAVGSGPEAPEVVVEGAARATSVGLRGVLNPHSVPVEAGGYRFLYRASKTECKGGGETVPGVSLGVEHEEVLEGLSGLKADTVYAVCVAAFDGGGETLSPVVTFKTALPPEVPVTGVAGSLTGTSAVLEGVLNPKAAGDPGGYEFVFRASAAECQEGAATPAGVAGGLKGEAVSTEAAGLVPVTQYTFCLLARNEAGEEALGAPVTFTTPAAPPVVESESASSVNAAEAALEAQVNPENEKTSYSFEYADEEALLGTPGATVLPGPGPLPAVFGGQAAGVATGAVLAHSTTYFYRVIAENQQSKLEGKPVAGPVQSFTTALAPETPKTEPAGEVTATTATLHGVLNPGAAGNPGSSEFLYSESETSCEGDKTVGAEAMSGSQGQAVQAGVSGLLPNATYSFCLLARNEAGETATSTALQLTTLPITPSIEAETAASITEASAVLTAKINPNGTQTTYKIEYDTAPYPLGGPAHGTTLTGANSLNGRVPLAVSIPVHGLSANTTYHWRLLATNTAGTTSTPDETFVYDTTSAGLPDGRQYELVTPPQKNGALIDAGFGGNSAWAPRIAENGRALIAPSIQCFAGAESCIGARLNEGEAYEFTRTPGGWVTSPLAPPVAKLETNTLWAADADQHTTLFSAPSPPQGQDDFYSRNSQGQLTDIGPLGEGREGTGGGSTFRKLSAILATSDFTHLAYEGEKLWPIEAGAYEYSGAGNTAPRPVGVTGGPNSTSLISSCGALLGSGVLSGPAEPYGALSADGRTAYFTAKTCGGGTGANASKPVLARELYARVDGEKEVVGDSGAHAVLVSGPASTGCGSVECEENNSSEPVKAEERARDSIFAGASNDGSRVFFTSTQQFTDNASEGEGEAGAGCHESPSSGCNLYESVCAAPCGAPQEEPAAKERELIDVSEAEGAKQASGGPRVQGVLAISSDGTHVYFVAQGVLSTQPNTQQQKAQDGADNLYAYERDKAHPEGKLTYITTLPKADEKEKAFSGVTEWNKGIGLANVTPDGRFLVFLSHGALTPDDTRPQGHVQVYRYDAQAGTLIRISIGEHGYNDNGNAGIADAGIAIAERGWALGVGAGRADPTMSHDGQYVFFESPVALVPGALDDTPTGSRQGVTEYAENIYEYHDGNVSLISDGKDTTVRTGAPGHTHSSTELIGSDDTGSNVFFATNDQLTSQDIDTQRDYYDARICTEIEPCPTPPPATTPCSEEACHTPTSPTPQTPIAGSNTLQSTGNLTPPPETPTAHATILTHTIHAHGAHITIRITLPLPGHITITANGIIKTSRVFNTSGTQTLKMTLTPTAQRSLHHKHHLTLKLHITYTSSAGYPISTISTLTIKS